MTDDLDIEILDIDDTEPVELEEVDVNVEPPEEWQSSAHTDMLTADPDVELDDEDEETD